ncbi:9702_t:CDS:2 [Gigaspora margarita]|uniref:9702_t:CDS:1 n=1 Tax=Gigaspora margarita TaxID=4874 RepID=A0ABM8W618_GIGMA|nr:9702_t:CDS:2 [Gigaspora margarita]
MFTISIFSFKHHIRQLKRYLVSLIIFTIFWTYTVNAQIYSVDQNWKRDTGGGLSPNTTFITATITAPTNTPNIATETTNTNIPITIPITTLITTPTAAPITTPITTPTVAPITTPLKINLTFEPNLTQWSFPIQFGTPPQTLDILTGITSNLLWAVSELCMSPFGDACNIRAATFFNTSLSNSLSGDFEEFTIDYVNGSEIIGIWVNDTIIINTQTFEQMHFGLPKDIIGTENITIPDKINGQIGIALTPNVSQGGSITFGGIDLEYILGNNESEIIYYQLPPTTVTTRLYVSNIYIDASLSGGKYSNGSGIADCYATSPNYDLSFEFENQNNQKWRLPLRSIIGKPIDSDHCSLTINGSAINSDSWVFGSAFIANFYMIFDQEKSLFGIALRSTIAQVAATKYLSPDWDWSARPGAIAYGYSSAHDGFSLTISGVSSYWIVFGVIATTEQDKWRGPFDNTQDYCWHFHGSEDDWEVFPCP